MQVACTVPDGQKIFKVIKGARKLAVLHEVLREDLYPNMSGEMSVDLDKFLRYLIRKQDGQSERA